MAVARRRLSLDLLRQAMDTTTKLSCFVVFILVGSTVFGLTFAPSMAICGSSIC